MNRLLILYILAIVSFLTACEDLPAVGPIFHEQEVEGSTKNIFSDPELGLINYYVQFESDTEFDEDIYHHHNITYVEDTLRIEIVDKTDSGFVFHESFTPGSATLMNFSDPNDYPQSTYLVVPTQKGWIISHESSWLFNFHHDPFTLPEEENGPFHSIQRYRLPLDIEILGREYQGISLSYNYGPMAYDGPGYQWYVTASKEIPRIAFPSATLPLGSGWDWLK